MKTTIWDLDKNTLDNKGIAFLSNFKNSDLKTVTPITNKQFENIVYIN